jgi:hypothetical protein
MARDIAGSETQRGLSMNLNGQYGIRLIAPYHGGSGHKTNGDILFYYLLRLDGLHVMLSELTAH